MNRISAKRKREMSSPEGKSFESMLRDTDRPFCWACGRDDRQRPDNWFADRWEMHRAHLAAGASKMIRLLDRRAAVILCPLCHFVHTTNGIGRNMVCGQEIPQLSNANVLFLKRCRDVDHWDPDWLAKHWLGNLPALVAPDQFFISQYATRRPDDPTRFIGLVA